MPDKDYAKLAAKHGGKPSQKTLPPALTRVEESLRPELKIGPMRIGYGSSAISSVAHHEPHVIEINDQKLFSENPVGIIGHELIHLWHNQLPGPLQNATPADNPANPYDLSDIFEWRKQGKTLATIPNEAAAAIVQNYIEVPHARPILQPWIDDLNKTPLSIMEPTDPAAITINRKVRPPLPPIDAYVPLTLLKKEASTRDPRRVR